MRRPGTQLPYFGPPLPLQAMELVGRLVDSKTETLKSSERNPENEFALSDLLTQRRMDAGEEECWQ